MAALAPDTVIDALAAFRLTRLVTTDRITARLRHQFIRRPLAYEFLTCDWCVGMWCAFGVVAARRVAPHAWQPVATALALSAVTGLIAENA